MESQYEYRHSVNTSEVYLWALVQKENTQINISIINIEAHKRDKTLEKFKEVLCNNVQSI